MEPEDDPGVYQLTVLSQGQTTLAESIRFNHTSRLALAATAEPFAPGQLLMLGDPGWSTFEIVQVKEVNSAPGQTVSYSVERGTHGTIGRPHPVGTPVTPIAVEHVPTAEAESLTGEAE